MERKRLDRDWVYTHAARDLSLEKTIELALGLGRSADDLSQVVGTAAQVAGHCMMPALSYLAHQALDAGGDIRFGEHRLQASHGAEPASIDILLTQRNMPGAFHLRVCHAAKLTEEGRALREKAMKKYEDLSFMDRIIAELHDKDVSRINSNPGLHSPSLPGDSVVRIKGTSLRTGAGEGFSWPGCPDRVDRDDTQDIKTYWPDRSMPCPQKMDIWWPGIAVDIEPLTSRSNDILRLGVNHGRGSPWGSLALMEVLSDIVVKSGLEDMVHDRFNDLAPETFLTLDIGNALHCTELGLACVAASNGFMDEQATRHIEAFFAQTLANKAHGMTDRILDVANILEERGFHSRENSYACNDLDDHAWVHRTDAALRLHVRSQNFDCQLEISESGLKAWDRRHGNAFLIVSFHADDAGYQPDWIGLDRKEEGAISFKRDNGGVFSALLLTIGSIHYNLEEEFGLDRDAGGPGL